MAYAVDVQDILAPVLAAAFEQVARHGGALFATGSRACYVDDARWRHYGRWRIPDFGSCCSFLQEFSRPLTLTVAASAGLQVESVRSIQILLEQLRSMIDSPRASNFAAMWSSPATSALELAAGIGEVFDDKDVAKAREAASAFHHADTERAKTLLQEIVCSSVIARALLRQTECRWDVG